MSETRRNPFSARSALLLIVGGAGLFVALLWMIGAGLDAPDANDGGGHGAGKGLNGFAGFARLVEKRGHTVSHSRSDDALRKSAILVLTPPHAAEPGDIDRIISERRQAGPTILVLPKWRAVQIPRAARPPEAKSGWVTLFGTDVPSWASELQSVGPLDAEIAKGSRTWSGLGLSGTLPDGSAVQTISSGRIAALVKDGRGQTLAGVIDDGNDYGALSAAAETGETGRVAGSALYPLVIVAEPDLIDNFGFARQGNARLAAALIDAVGDGERLPVVFDLTLNGHARTANLLTLAFTPPFLAATLCLLLAALVIGWRAFIRFGPPRKAERSIAFGKGALVANSAGFMRRTRRLHLLTGPYADRARVRIAHALGLARQTGADDTERAIDRALASRESGSEPFSHIAARLRAAKKPHQAVNAARELHAVERNLTR